MNWDKLSFQTTEEEHEENLNNFSKAFTGVRSREEALDRLARKKNVRRRKNK